MYNTTAFLYEATAAFEQPEATCDEIQAIFQKHAIQPPGLLGDLGSGTGLMSILFAQRGWHIYGLELSSTMIAVAEEKKRPLPVDLQSRLDWTQENITEFSLPDALRLDGAVCLCNTINHLVEWKQVEGFIQSAFKAIRPGGVLILDSDRLDTFQGFFNHPPTVVWEDEAHRLTRACSFNEASGRASHRATVEHSTPAGWQVISEEDMALQYHDEGRLSEAFQAGGFQLESAAPFNPSPRLYEGLIPKVLWTFRRQ